MIAIAFQDNLQMEHPAVGKPRVVAIDLSGGRVHQNLSRTRSELEPDGGSVSDSSNYDATCAHLRIYRNNF